MKLTKKQQEVRAQAIKDAEEHQWYRIVLPYAIFGIKTKKDTKRIVDAPPIGLWLIGKTIDECTQWVLRKSGTIKPN